MLDYSKAFSRGMKAMLVSTMLLCGTEYSYADSALSRCEASDLAAAAQFRVTALCPEHGSYLLRLKGILVGKGLSGTQAYIAALMLSKTYQGVPAVRQIKGDKYAFGSTYR